MIQQGSALFGVRFGSTTQYCLIDIDSHSPYHPNHDPLAISRIAAALEPVGLVNHLTCTSSYSGGLHLYFPFPIAQNSWELAIAVAALLETNGFKLKPSQLELFPDPKPYRVEGTPNLFNAHRLPMQAGSYLVDSDFQPIWSDPEQFAVKWHSVAAQNILDTAVLKRIIKQVKRCCYHISGKADKFINDLNAEIEPGWTGSGQTNYLLGRITMRAYIFNHVLTGKPPLEGHALVTEIVRTARALPGYETWCQHRHELEHRATEWASCIENSHYFHYGDAKGRYQTKLESSELKSAATELPSWNQQQSESARGRIKAAIVDLLERNALPVRPTARFKALIQAGIGGGSLYRHRDLWHPDYFDEFGTEKSIELEARVVQNTQRDLQKSQQEISQPDQTINTNTINNSLSSQTSLLHTAGGDNLQQLGFSDLSTDFEPVGGNNLGESGIVSQDWLAVQVVATAEARTNAQKICVEAQQQAHLARIQRYFASGDPILIAEALAWLEVAQLPRPDD